MRERLGTAANVFGAEDARRWDDEPVAEVQSTRVAGSLVGRPASRPVAQPDLPATALHTRLADVLRREPITTTVGTSIRDAARLMAEERVSSLLVVEGERLVGLVTDRDLRTRVVAADRDPGEPVGRIMTTDLVTAEPDDLALELVLRMTDRNIHHLPVVSGGRILGVVTSNDLMRLEQANPIHLVGDIAKAANLAALVPLSRRLPEVVDQLVRQEAAPDVVGRIVTAVGDAIERRLLELAEDQLGPSPAPYVWVVLGSGARLEQNLGSDQDHALVLGDEARPEDYDYFAALAEQVSSGLEACGFPRCPGNIMATNSRWRAPLRAWQRTFTEWVTEPVPDAVLASSIFFDLRALHGDQALFDDLHRHVLALTPGSDRFLAHLTRHAVANQPPLGSFGRFALERRGPRRGTLDLKRGGLHAVVEIARVQALAHGLPEVATLPRLAAVADAGGLSPQTAADLHDAYEFLRRVRLSHQARRLRAGQPPDNRLAPAELSGFDRSGLRDAFQIIRSAQQAVQRSQPLGFVT
jgi:CBS domain-containing protein